MFPNRFVAASAPASSQGKPDKRSPEQNGYRVCVRGLYVKDAPPRGAKAVGCVEIGNLDEVAKAQLPNGVASIEVLCNRQSLFGNPFSLLKAQAPTQTKGETHDGDAGCSTVEGASSRDDVCLAFSDFLHTVLSPMAEGCLIDIAEAIACRRGLPPTVISREWRRDFGPLLCVAFRTAFHVLQDMAMTRRCDGEPGIRLMCHCVPLRCHCESIALRISNPPALAGQLPASVAVSPLPVDATPVSIGSRLYLQSIGFDVGNLSTQLFRKPTCLPSQFMRGSDPFGNAEK